MSKACAISGTQKSQTVQVPDTYPNQHWVPIALHLPRLPAGATLRVTILPRTSLLYDTTLFSFLGFAPAGGSGADA